MSTTRSVIDGTALGVVALLALTACGTGGSAPAPIGNRNATSAYWDELHRPCLAADTFELLSSTTLDSADPASVENTVGLWKEFATAERKRCERIAALPVMDVDPRLVAYTTELVKLRQQTAAISEASVREYEERSSLLDPERLGVDFVLSLAMHSNDGEAAIANALLDQASAKATDVRNLQARQNEIGDRFRTHAEQIEALNADEITLRSQLSQSFGREFPAGSTYPKSLPPNSDSAPSGVPAKDAVAKDLVGHRIDRPAWTFDSVREFQTLNVTYAKPANDVLRIAVQTRVRGILSGDQHDLSLRVTYRNQAGAWKWFSVAQVK